MTTPANVAVGNRDHWRGVPCQMDGYETWTASVLVDRVVRTGSVAAAADQVVTGFGWRCVGGDPLDQVDDFLAETELTEAAPADVLDRHYGIYVLDPDGRRLELFVGGRWVEPVELGPDGIVTHLPFWYPQLGTQPWEKRRRPDAITKRLQASCRAKDVAWSSLTQALRNWVTSQLGDLHGVAWLYKESGTGTDGIVHVRCLVEDTFVYLADDADGTYFKSADGRLRRFTPDDVDRLEACFGELGIRRSHALDILGEWLNLAYVTASGHEDAIVVWMAGTRRWEFNVRRFSVDRDAFDPSPIWLATFFSWVF